MQNMSDRKILKFPHCVIKTCLFRIKGAVKFLKLNDGKLSHNGKGGTYPWQPFNSWPTISTKITWCGEWDSKDCKVSALCSRKCEVKAQNSRIYLSPEISIFTILETLNIEF